MSEEQELHPDLAALFAAGDSVLPSDNSSSKDIDNNIEHANSDDVAGDGAALSLESLLSELLKLYVNQAREHECRPTPPRRQLDTHIDGVGDDEQKDDLDGLEANFTAGLGVAFSIGAPTRINATNSDINNNKNNTTTTTTTNSNTNTISNNNTNSDDNQTNNNNDNKTNNDDTNNQTNNSTTTDNSNNTDDGDDDDVESVLDCSRLVVNIDDISTWSVGRESGDLFFKLGNPFPHINDRDVEFVCDRHKPFHAPMIELAVEHQYEKNNDNDNHTFPTFVRDHKVVFETTWAAKSYYKRSWRYLSENWVPDTIKGEPQSTTVLYGKIIKDEVKFLLSLADEVRCFGSSQQTQIKNNEAVVVSDDVIVVYRIANVVGKTFFAASSGVVPQDLVNTIINSVAKRIRSWSNEIRISNVLKKLHPQLHDFRLSFIAEWKTRIQTLLLACSKSKSKSPKVSEYLKETCSVCNRTNAHNRCSGCRVFVYCSTQCQKSHWLLNHKLECTFEFVESKLT